MELQPILWVIPAAGIAAIAFALYLAWDVLRADTGTPAMQEIADIILEGAVAFIRRQYRTIGLLAIGGAVLIGGVIPVVEGKEVADTSIFGADLGIRTGVAFLVGAACSMASGIIGMYISVKANLRTAAAAQSSLVRAVQMAMRGGAGAGSTPRRPMAEPTWSARSRRASPRMTHATPGSWPTSWATTSATAPAAAPTCSNRPRP